MPTFMIIAMHHSKADYLRNNFFLYNKVMSNEKNGNS